MLKASKQTSQLSKRDLSTILTKNDRTFLPVGDISTFKRPNLSILHAEQSARCIKLRD
jgi:hypothetical protein